jgi:DnaJ homolog subfamily C member 19
MKLLFWIFAGVVLWWLWKNGTTRKPGLSRTDAAKLLGLPVDAAPEAILEAHKRLIAKVHPDAGGSAELASQINRARDVLLSQISQ